MAARRGRRPSPGAEPGPKPGVGVRGVRRRRVRAERSGRHSGRPRGRVRGRPPRVPAAGVLTGERHAVIVALLQLRDRTARAGLFRTMHSLTAALDTAGWELAELITRGR